MKTASTELEARGFGIFVQRLLIVLVVSFIVGYGLFGGGFMP